MSYLFPYAGSERRLIASPLPKPEPKIEEPAPQVAPVKFTHSPILQLLHAVCEHHGVKFEAIRGASRTTRLVHARRDFIVRGRAQGYSFSRIAMTLKKDHSTCVYHYHLYLNGAPVTPVPVRKR